MLPLESDCLEPLNRFESEGERVGIMPDERLHELDTLFKNILIRCVDHTWRNTSAESSEKPITAERISQWRVCDGLPDNAPGGKERKNLCI